MKITDTLEEQELLESLIEETKPRIPPECESLHYLLSTPFRYTPYLHTTRFRGPGSQEGVFYCAEAPQTAILEMAFYRVLRFYQESPETAFPANPGEFTVFSIQYASANALDLTAAPFAAQAAIWTHPTDYSKCLDFVAAARIAECQIIRYQSVRDTQARCNLAILSCRAFADSDPHLKQTWSIHLNGSGARAVCEFPKSTVSVTRDNFSRDPRLADFNWNR